MDAAPVAPAPVGMRAPAAPLAGLAARAEAVLQANWRGRHTVTSAALYPHQWSWDSAFVAIGLAPTAQHRAQLELATLLGAQWPDGRIPHIVFDPDTPVDAYFRAAWLPRVLRRRHRRRGRGRRLLVDGRAHPRLLRERARPGRR